MKEWQTDFTGNANRVFTRNKETILLYFNNETKKYFSGGEGEGPEQGR